MPAPKGVTTEAMRASPGSRGMGRPQVPWRRMGREVLLALDAGATMGSQARACGVADATLRRGLRECGWVVMRVPRDPEQFPQLKRARIAHIGELVKVHDAMEVAQGSAGKRASVSVESMCVVLAIATSHADAIGKLMAEYRGCRTFDDQEQLFAKLPGPPGNPQMYDPDRPSTPYRRAPQRSMPAPSSDQAGRDVRDLKITDAEIIKRYRRHEQSLRTIAEAAGCSASTIGDRLRAYGVPRRPRSATQSNVSPVGRAQ